MCSTDQVEKELARILESRHFRSAARSSQFLSYVVRAKLQGETDRLKERTIGAEVFDRDPDYSTGEDPVVRVSAGEVRRRLERFYEESKPIDLRIDLPIGTYSPVFIEETQPGPATEDVSHHPTEPASAKRSLLPLWIILATCALFAYGGWFLLRSPHSGPQPTAIRRFWAPIFNTKQPTLVCLEKLVVYRPSMALYNSYAEKHPGEFDTQTDRLNKVLPLAPSQTIKWSDMERDEDVGMGSGDVDAAIKISTLLSRMDAVSQVRIGRDYSFGDLRNSPAVLIGAYSSRWTMRLAQHFPFTFEEKNGLYWIHEQKPNGRIWQGTPEEDYGVIARLPDSETGQFTVVLAGIKSSGSEAAASFVTDGSLFNQIAGKLPSDWDKHNLEIVIKTTISDGVSGPPEPIAFATW